MKLTLPFQIPGRLCQTRVATGSHLDSITSGGHLELDFAKLQGLNTHFGTIHHVNYATLPLITTTRMNINTLKEAGAMRCTMLKPHQIVLFPPVNQCDFRLITPQTTASCTMH